MRGLALCLVAAALAIAGCGSDDSAGAPSAQQAAVSGGKATSVAVSANVRAAVGTFCAAEGKGRPKRQCMAGLKKLDQGKVANPAAACKGLSKKKTKGVRGKSPFAVCVKAAAKLMAAKRRAGNGAADSSSPDDSAESESDDSADDSESDDSESGDSADDEAGSDEADDDDKGGKGHSSDDADEPGDDSEPDDPAGDD